MSLFLFFSVCLIELSQKFGETSKVEKVGGWTERRAGRMMVVVKYRAGNLKGTGAEQVG